LAALEAGVCLSGAAREWLPVGGLELAEHASAPDRIAVSAAGQFLLD
jgi:hypothetical protein